MWAQSEHIQFEDHWCFTTISYWDFIKLKQFNLHQFILCGMKFISTFSHTLLERNYQENYQEMRSNMCVCVRASLLMCCTTESPPQQNFCFYYLHSSTNLLQCKHSTRFQNIISFRFNLAENYTLHRERKNMVVRTTDWNCMSDDLWAIFS